MIKVNVFEAKAKLSEYLDRATRGERIVICRHNRPVAELRAVGETRTAPRPVGPLPGRPTFEVPPAFFEPLGADELELWEGVAPHDPLGSGIRGERSRVSKVTERRPRQRAQRGRRTRS